MLDHGQTEPKEHIGDSCPVAGIGGPGEALDPRLEQKCDDRDLILRQLKWRDRDHGGQGKFIATGGIVPGEESQCSGKVQVTQTSISGEESL